MVDQAMAEGAPFVHEEALGVWVTDLPVTPERVLQALAKKQ